MRPTEFAPGVTKGSGSMAAADWMVRWAEGLEPTPRNLTLRWCSPGGEAQSRTFRFHISQYLTRRAKDWADRGFKETLTDWPALNARSKFWGDDQRAAFKNWEEIDNLYEPPKGIADNIQRREFLRRVLMKVIRRTSSTYSSRSIRRCRRARSVSRRSRTLNDRAISYPLGPNAGITEVLIPAGYVKVAYDPVFELATDARGRKFYRSRTGTTPTEAPAPRHSVLDQFPRRAGHGARGAESGHRLPVRIEAPRASAPLPALIR